MAIKVGINGYGRIGRNVLRGLYEGKRNGEIQIVAINDLGDANTNAHLTRFDTAHGRFPGQVSVDGDSLVVNGDRIRVLPERAPPPRPWGGPGAQWVTGDGSGVRAAADPGTLPWGERGVEYVLECTGLFANKEKAGKHIAGGAKR